MQLFISWSGERSKAVASAIRDWLPLIIQSVKPWFSPEDIDKGARWLADLNLQLEKQSVAIICITPENLNAPWLLFEVGALSKALETSWVCPILYGMEPTDVQGPLAQFQSTRTTKDDMRRLLSTVNRRLDVPLSDQQLDTLHDLLWPQLAEKLEALAKVAGAQRPPHRQTPELLSEMLTRIRAIERQLSISRGHDDSLRRRMLSSPFSSLERISRLRERMKFVTAELDAARDGRDAIQAQLDAITDADVTKKAELSAKYEQHLKQFLANRHELDRLAEEYESLRTRVDRLPPTK